MKSLHFLLFPFIIISSSCQADDKDTSVITHLRNNFYKAIEDENTTEYLSEFIKERFSENYNEYPPVVLAYYGGVEALKAKHAFNPLSKFSNILYSLNRLEEAVEKEPDNLEIRFMRFSILHHLPGFLGNEDELITDRDKIYNLLMKKDSELPYDIQKGIISFMLESERLTKHQKAKLSQLEINTASNE